MGLSKKCHRSRVGESSAAVSDADSDLQSSPAPRGSHSGVGTQSDPESDCDCQGTADMKLAASRSIVESRDPGNSS